MNARMVTLRRIALAGLALAPVGAAPFGSGHAKAQRGDDIQNLGGPVGADDFVTGGGWIDGTPSGEPGTFGFVVDGRRDELRGRVNFVDHDDGLHVRSESITSYVEVDAETRRIEGTALVDGDPGETFTLTVRDSGEPGATDTFSIQLSSGYDASGTLEGGNIQLHLD